MNSLVQAAVAPFPNSPEEMRTCRVHHPPQSNQLWPGGQEPIVPRWLPEVFFGVLQMQIKEECLKDGGKEAALDIDTPEGSFYFTQ